MRPSQLRAVVAVVAVLLAAIGLILSTGSDGDRITASAAGAVVGAQASTPGIQPVVLPAVNVAVADSTPAGGASPIAGATATRQPVDAALDTNTEAGTETSAGTETTVAGVDGEEPASEPEPAPETTPAPTAPPAPEILTLGSIKSKADEKGYDVHGHVEHSVYLLGQQVLIPGQAATGGVIQTSEYNYMAYSPLTAMLPVAIQDNKEVVNKKPNLEGEDLYRRLAQEYTGSNDYKKLDSDARRAINILTCTDWSLVDKKVRENTINHLLHSPISFGTIGSVEQPITTDVKIDLGYTHTRDKNWTEVEYMDNNVYKITVVSNNNNGSHTGHAMGTAFVEMPEGTSLKEAQKIGNQMIPSKNKNNKLTIDPAARTLYEALPRGASPMILFEHLTEAEQNAFFEGRGIEVVGQPNPDCNPLEGGILSPAPTEEDSPTEPTEGETPDPAEGETPVEPADGETPVEPVEGETPDPTEGETPDPTEGETPVEPADGATPDPGDEETPVEPAAETPTTEPEEAPSPTPTESTLPPNPAGDSG